jgi:hypothetical protein
MGSLLTRKCCISIDLPFKINYFLIKQGVSHTISALFSSLARRLWNRNGDLYPSSLALLGILFYLQILSHLLALEGGSFTMGHQQEVLYHSCFTSQSSADFVKQEWEVFSFPKSVAYQLTSPLSLNYSFNIARGFSCYFWDYPAV